MDRFAECGGNFIDTANTYNWGESEQIIGSWLKKYVSVSSKECTKHHINSWHIGPFKVLKYLKKASVKNLWT